VHLSTAFFPPVEYFALLAKYSSVYIEFCESYQKQSYRNRCTILTANGPMDLRFPIIHDGTSLISQIKVDYSTDWVGKFEYALDSAYYGSPFFEYYRDELFAILDSKPSTLWELDSRTLDFCLRKIGLKCSLVPTSDFSLTVPDDFRQLIHPKKESLYESKKYYQVFSSKFGFTPRLSILDLLFNEGPESICYL